MNLSQINKKLALIGGVVVGLVVVAVIAIFIIARDNNLEFSAIEQQLRRGAEKYFKDNANLLPKENGQKTVVDVTTLENGEYIPLLSKMVKNDVVCNGEVRVSKNGKHYLYVPYLNCGKEYVTEELYKKIINPSNIVTKDDGLYKINNEYVFRGEPTNNFVEFAGQKWLIIKVDKDNHIKIMQYENKNRFAWDNRYNIDRNSNEGINNYLKSSIETELLNLFDSEELIPEKEKRFVVYKPFCIGKRSETAADKSGKVECAKMTKAQPLGLITVGEFLTASLDKNCKTTYDASCQNYNYLAKFEHSWWTITGNKEKSHRIYRVSETFITDTSASNEIRIKPVLHLSDNIIYSGGIGTFDDPYIIK